MRLDTAQLGDVLLLEVFQRLRGLLEREERLLERLRLSLLMVVHLDVLAVKALMVRRERAARAPKSTFGRARVLEKGNKQYA